MDFAFTQEQDMLSDSVARTLEKSYDFEARKAIIASDQPWSKVVWQQFAELGLMALPFDEEVGGLGGSASDCTAFLRSIGQYLVVEPYIHSTILAGGIIAAGLNGSGENAAHPDLLEMIMSGEAVAAFAYEEGNGTASLDQIATRAEVTDEGFLLSGEKRLVIAGDAADAFVVAARRSDTGAVAMFLVDCDAKGIAARSYLTVDGRSAANVTFDQVAVSRDALLIDAIDARCQAVFDKAILALAAEAVGAMEALLKLTGEYAMTRKQFGQPIGAFQTVAHRLADMKIAYCKALATLTYTTALADSGALTARDMAILKGQLGKLGREIGEAAIQTHGGVGMTDELNISHYHKRLLAFDAQFGDHAFHLRCVGARHAKEAIA